MIEIKNGFKAIFLLAVLLISILPASAQDTTMAIPSTTLTEDVAIPSTTTTTQPGIACPLYMPPSPGWCENGTIVPRGPDENGCAGPPKCVRDDDRMIPSVGVKFKLKVGETNYVKEYGVTLTLESIAYAGVICTVGPYDKKPACEDVVTGTISIVYDEPNEEILSLSSFSIGLGTGYVLETNPSSTLTWESFDKETSTGLFVIKDYKEKYKTALLGRAFELRFRETAMISGTGLTLTLERIYQRGTCAILEGEEQECKDFSEAIVTVTLKSINSANSGQTIISTDIGAKSTGIGAKLTIKEGNSKYFGRYVINFEKKISGGGLFSVKKAYIITETGVETLPSMTFVIPTAEEGYEIVTAESVTFKPGDNVLRIKEAKSKAFKNINTNLKEGFVLPVQTEKGMRNLILKTNPETIETIIQDGEAYAVTRAPIVSRQGKIYIETEDGEEKLVKILPSVASQKAIEALGEKFDRIELKDVGRPVYEATKEVNGKFFGIIPVKMKYITQIDAESGDVIFTKKPWYKAFTVIEKPSEETNTE